jgi:seryl-tRNA synthetase
MTELEKVKLELSKAAKQIEDISTMNERIIRLNTRLMEKMESLEKKFLECDKLSRMAIDYIPKTALEIEDVIFERVKMDIDQIAHKLIINKFRDISTFMRRP